MTKTKNSTTANSKTDEVLELQRLTYEGEGHHLEFKRKASHPEKIVREMIAFANTDGGTILIGVDDNGSLSGVKYPDEELLSIREALEKHVRQPLIYQDSLVTLSENRFILRLDIPPNLKRPVLFWVDSKRNESYVRVNDMSVKASDEMIEIIRRKRQKKDIRFYFAEHELALMKYLEKYPSITSK